MDKTFDEKQLEEHIKAVRSRKEKEQRKFDSVKFRWLSALICIGFFIICFVAIFFGNLQSASNSYILAFLIVRYVIYGLLVGLLGYSAYVGSVKLFFWNRVEDINNLLLEHGILDTEEDKIKAELKKDDDFFTNLVSINFKYIDKYYYQTQQQANKSFAFAVSAGVAGFMIVCIGILMMYSTDKVTPAYVTTASGVLGEFISAVFFFLYNRTIVKMSQYHQKLVITQNISLALKTAEQLKEERGEVLKSIIDRLTTDVNKYLTDFKE